LFRDRKAVGTHLLIAAGYVIVLYYTLYMLVRTLFFPHWPAPLPDREWIRLAFLILLVVMVHRLLQRAIATTRIYGPLHGLLAVPRQVWSNLVNIRASVRATRQFLRAEWAGASVAWDKTHHHVPQIATTNGGRRRVGEILRGWGEITASQLQQALEAQLTSRRRIGEELIEQGFISRSQLVRALRGQADEELPYSTRG
jgi:adsorption protein B